jgi:hypothetical protein
MSIERSLEVNGWRTLSRSWRLVMAMLVVAIAGAAALAVGEDRAAALCVAAHEEGVWVNTNSVSPGISRIELRACQPITTCDGDVCTTTYDAGWAMRVWGKCSPTDCYWGRVSARRLADGRVRGFYDQGFAKRYVYARMSQYRPGQLWVFWRTDFTDPSRPDYTKQEWFRKVS